MTTTTEVREALDGYFEDEDLESLEIDGRDLKEIARRTEKAIRSNPEPLGAFEVLDIIYQLTEDYLEEGRGSGEGPYL